MAHAETIPPYMVAPTDRSSGWPLRYKTDPFCIAVPDQVGRVSSLAHPSIRELCERDDRVRSSCAICGRNPVLHEFKCQGCLFCYCSARCRDRDKEAHELACGKLDTSDLADFARPSQRHVQAVIFPSQEAGPVPVWLKTNYVQRQGRVELASLSFDHDEFWSFATQFEGEKFLGFRMGCINEATALKPRKLGKGLFVLEWALNLEDPRQRDLSLEWVNESITALGEPGHIWYWTGPIVVFACDPAKCVFSSGKPSFLALEDIEPRDMRNIVDFFQLNLRNPCLTDPLQRLPLSFKYTYGYKLNDINSPVAQAMCIEKAIERVKVAFETPQTVGLKGQAPSLLGDFLGLSWVVRSAHCHGPEYHPFYEERVNLWNPHWLSLIMINETSKELKLRKGVMIPTGESIIMIHASALDPPMEYLGALLDYIPLMLPEHPEKCRGVLRNTNAKLKGGRGMFGVYWDIWCGKNLAPEYLKERRIRHPHEYEEIHNKRVMCAKEFAMRDKELGMLVRQRGERREARKTIAEGERKGEDEANMRATIESATLDVIGDYLC